jgi:hypothetical protein
LAFCGAPNLAREIHYNKISNDMITAMTGHCRSHIMDYVSESYGGKKAVVPPDKKTTEEESSISLEIDDDDTCVEVQLLTNRKTVSYLKDSSVALCSMSFPDIEPNHGDIFRRVNILVGDSEDDPC